VQASAVGTDGFRLSFAEPRGAMRGMSEFDAGVFAEARSMVDWNFRNKVGDGQHGFVVFHSSSATSAQFCASCGSPVYSVWGGWKLSCSSLLSTSDNTGKEALSHPVRLPPPYLSQVLQHHRLVARKGLHNITHPRTDAVVIVASPERGAGQNPPWAERGSFWSCVASRGIP
jgi:NAD+ diphosphatase